MQSLIHKGTNHSLGLDGLRPSPLALNQPQTAFLWYPHEEKLSGAFGDDPVFSLSREKSQKVTGCSFHLLFPFSIRPQLH